jgi:hypothetical protein
LNIAVQEFYGKYVVAHGRGLSYQLVQALFVDDSRAVPIRVGPVIGAGNLAVEQHTESDRLSVNAGAQHQV